MQAQLVLSVRVFFSPSRCNGLTFPHVKVVGLPRLLGLTDATLKAFGKRCHELSSLNLARSGDFTDAGVKALLKVLAWLIWLSRLFFFADF